MKYLILSFLIVLMSNIYVNAENKIPGFLELDLNTGRDYDFYGRNGTEKHNIGYAEVNLKYGGEFNWFKPYGFVGWKTFFMYNDFKRNYPFRDIYSWGAGFGIKIFYFEYEHKCSHAVFSAGKDGDKYMNLNEKNYLLFEGMPTLTYDRFKIGIKLRVD